MADGNYNGRNTYSEEQKTFLVDYELTIVKAFHVFKKMPCFFE